MWSLTSARSPRSSGAARIAARLWRLILVLELALKVRRERRRLLRMDDRALKDVGFDRGRAYNEARRSFWDIPTDRMRL